MRVIPSEEHILRELEQIRAQARQLNETLDAIYTQLLDLERRDHDADRPDQPVSRQRRPARAPTKQVDR